MNQTKEQLWERFQRFYREFPSIGLAIDLSRVNFAGDFFETMAAPMDKAFAAMAALEKGALANPDERRMVGHYWLRNSALAPTSVIQHQIDETLAAVQTFAADVHQAKVRGANGPFKNLLLIGIGGSALGPQFVSHALGHPATDKMAIHFFDNTDPDGMDKVLASLSSQLGQTLCVVISKSGGTKETRNGMLEARAAYEHAGLSFASHAVAVTGDGSELDRYAHDWLRRFPMWDWVGGRTSETSAVGLLPAALQGIDITKFLSGAKACDELTRKPSIAENPAAQLALMWFHIGNGKGQKDMVVLPYKNRLELFSRYLQQLVMESIGKELDLDGRKVNQGLAVYGNKGSTDQHAYVQQLRDGINNFFVIFIEVLKDRESAPLFVANETTSGDYLDSFLLGTRDALHANGRESITLTLEAVSGFTVGALIALFERAVGLYASLINVNAYHQPGVEAGKKAAESLLELQSKLIAFTKAHSKKAMTAAELAKSLGGESQPESVFKICAHLAANRRGIVQVKRGGPAEATFAGA